MRAAQGTADQMQNKLRALERDAFAARKTLKEVSMDRSQSEAVRMRADEMKHSLDSVYKAALAADKELDGLGFQPSQVATFVAEAKVMQHELEVLKRDAAAAKREMNDINALGRSSMMSDVAATHNANVLSRLRTMQIQRQFQAAADVADMEARSRATGILAGTNNQGVLSLLRAAQIRRQFEASTAAMIPNRDMRAGIIPSQDMRAAANMEEWTSRAILPGGGRGAIGSGDGGGGYNNRTPIERFFRGLLPGGRRAGAGVVTAGLGILGGLGVGAAPGVAGLGIAGADAFTGLAGAAATLKLAFSDLTAQAFTNQAAFDKLTPIQQHLVQTLRSLDAGLGKTLEGIAQRGLIPRLTSALHTLFTPALGGALQTSVGAFAQGIGQGAQGAAGVLGSSSFAGAFQTTMVNNAKYVQQFIISIAHLTSAFFHLTAAAKPLTDWLSKSFLAFSKWTDTSIKALQASGGLTQFFEKAKLSIQAMAKGFDAVWHLVKALASVVGFENSIRLWQLLSDVINTIAKTLRDMSPTTRALFGGLISALQDVLSLLRPILSLFTQLLNLINKLIGGTQHWRVVLDALFAVLSLRVLADIAKRLALIGVAEKTLSINALAATGSIGKLRAVLLALSSGAVLGSIAKLGLKFGGFVTAVYEGQKFLSNLTGFGASGGTQSPAIAKSGNYTIPPRGTLAHTAFWAGAHGQSMPPGVRGSDEAENAYLAGQYAYKHGGKLPPARAVPAGNPVVGMIGGALGGIGVFDNPFGTPDPLKTGTGTGRTTVLPIALETAINMAIYRGSPAGINIAAQAGLDWINKNLPSMSPTEKNAAAEEGTYLKSLITRENKSAAKAALSRQQVASNKAASYLRSLILSRLQGHASALGLTTAEMHRLDRAAAARELRHGQLGLERMLGVGPGADASPSAAHLLSREQRLISTAQAKHITIPEKTLDSLHLIERVLHKALDQHIKLNSAISGNISDRLTQINETLKQQKLHIPTYHMPSLKELLHGLTAIKNPRARRQVADRLLELEIYHGRLPTYHSTAGIPVFSSGANIPGGVQIIIQGYEKDPKVLAAEVRDKLLQHHRRNPTQTRGPNAGKNLGLG